MRISSISSSAVHVTIPTAVFPISRVLNLTAVAVCVVGVNHLCEIFLRQQRNPALRSATAKNRVITHNCNKAFAVKPNRSAAPAWNQANLLQTITDLAPTVLPAEVWTYIHPSTAGFTSYSRPAYDVQRASTKPQFGTHASLNLQFFSIVSGLQTVSTLLSRSFKPAVSALLTPDQPN